MVEQIEIFSDFLEIAKSKKLVIFGAGKYFKGFCQRHNQYQLETYVDYVVDNNKKLWNSTVDINGSEVEIYSPQYLYDNVDKDTVILVSTVNYEEICSELNQQKQLDESSCYILSFMYDMINLIEAYDVPSLPKDYRLNETEQIPKKIHYCWFGGNEMSELNKMCIESFRKMCPEYEIIEWNELNYDIRKSKYMHDAHKSKKWGFVPDYARLDIIYEYGGIYFDTDVELIRSIDEVLFNNSFAAVDLLGNVALGLGFGAKKSDPLIKKLRDVYDNVDFIKADGSLNLTTTTHYSRVVFEKQGFKRDGTFQIVSGMSIYPAEYFCTKLSLSPITNVTENSFSIHHHEGSWITDESKKVRQERRSKLMRIMEKLNKNRAFD